MKTAIGISIVLHLLVISSFFLFEFPEPAKPPVINAFLVRLGKPRETTLLPQKSVEPESEPTPKVSPEEHRPVTHKVATKAHKPQELSSALKRLKKELNKWHDDTGNEKGSRAGNNPEGVLADSYNQHLVELIKESYELPSTLSKEQRLRLSLMVRLFIDSKGDLTKVTLESPSGNSVFDNAVVRGAKQVRHFGPPPLVYRQFYLKKGVVLEFCPVRCQ